MKKKPPTVDRLHERAMSRRAAGEEAAVIRFASCDEALARPGEPQDAA